MRMADLVTSGTSNERLAMKQPTFSDVALVLLLTACSNSSGPNGSGSTGTWASLSAGTEHTCALTPGGSAYCWGSDLAEALGDGSAHDGGYSATPVAVAGGLRFTAISAAQGKTCAVTTAGKAYCWGSNANGSLGNGDTTVSQVDVPTPVVGGLTFKSIKAGVLHVCALTSAGDVYCWGDNYSGALGTSGVPRYNSASPLKVTGTTVFGSIFAGNDQSSCALDTAGSAYCWGFNGLLGTGDTTTGVYAPKAVTGGLKFVTLATDAVVHCGVATGGAAYCWGDGRWGNLGGGNVDTTSIPSPVVGGISFTAVQPGKAGHFTCGLASNKAAWCWGSMPFVLADTSSAVRSSPVPVAVGMSFDQFSSGGYHACGLTASGDVYCWGVNTYGQLGDGTTTPNSTPVKVVAP